MKGHGTEACYRRGCRCDACKRAKSRSNKSYSDANREKVRDSQRRYLESVAEECKDPGSYRHGSLSAYTAGCRCDRCREMHSGWLRAWRAS